MRGIMSSTMFLLPARLMSRNNAATIGVGNTLAQATFRLKAQHV